MNKYKLKINGNLSGKSFDQETPLFEALAEAGYPVDTPCGGRGFCGGCSTSVKGCITDSLTGEKIVLGEPAETRTCTALISGNIEVTLRRKQTIIMREPSALPALKDMGLAVDIGTTSIHISMVNMSDGRSYSLGSWLNPQRRYGHDVIARISAASEKTVREYLASSVRNIIRSAAAGVINNQRVNQSSLRSVVLSGNTAMIYLLLGIDPAPLGAHPYHAPVRDFRKLDRRTAGLEDFSCKVDALPAASAYIGGDLIGGLALCSLMKPAKNLFFIDLGTNGEIFVTGGSGKTTAASCAMGPALEGMNISCGMTAAEGAVSHAGITNGRLILHTIGDARPSGICGTGLIDLCAASIRSGLILKNGSLAKNFDESLLPEGLIFDADQKRILIGNNLYITQKDIRNIQLAKGASLAASNILLRDSATQKSDVKKVVIAGAFGENLNIANFSALSFIPDFENAEYIFLGNTSLQAAERGCFDNKFIDLCSELRESLNVINLAGYPGFEDEFIKSIDF